MLTLPASREFLLAPVSAVFIAANYLRQAVDAHNSGAKDEAANLFRAADLPEVREWTERIWGQNNREIVCYRPVSASAPHVPKTERVPLRMPNRAEQTALIQRDGFHCRFCGIPVIPKSVRQNISRAYPDAVPWGRTNPTQHAAFQAMWLQFDHILPHARGGDNSVENVVITCAPCNYGRMNYTLDEVGLIDPRTRPPTQSDWNGLIDFSL